MNSETPNSGVGSSGTITNLRALQSGQMAVVTAINHDVPEVRHKYVVRGIVPGARVRMLHDGDPIVVALEESRWAIDGAEAEFIEVVPLAIVTRGNWWRRAVRVLRRGVVNA